MKATCQDHSTKCQALIQFQANEVLESCQELLHQIHSCVESPNHSLLPIAARTLYFPIVAHLLFNITLRDKTNGTIICLVFLILKHLGLQSAPQVKSEICWMYLQSIPLMQRKNYTNSKASILIMLIEWRKFASIFSDRIIHFIFAYIIKTPWLKILKSNKRLEMQLMRQLTN